MRLHVLGNMRLLASCAQLLRYATYQTYSPLSHIRRDSSSEDIDELMTEASLPLKMLMERYSKDQESPDEEKEGKFSCAILE